MPMAWSWYQSVEARLWLGYWKMEKPLPQVAPKPAAALALKKSYQVPSVAYPAGMSLAAGRNQASA